MTKKQIEKELQFHIQKVMELQKQMESAVDELEMQDYEKPYHKMTIAELSDLRSIKESAFDWFEDEQHPERKKMSVLDYNRQALKINRIPLAD